MTYPPRLSVRAFEKLASYGGNQFEDVDDVISEEADAMHQKMQVESPKITSPKSPKSRSFSGSNQDVWQRMWHPGGAGNINLKGIGSSKFDKCSKDSPTMWDQINKADKTIIHGATKDD